MYCITHSADNGCYHTKVITTSTAGKISGTIYKEFKPESARDTAHEIIKLAIDNYPNRNPDRVRIPERPMKVMAGAEGSAHFLHPRDFGGEADAARAVDAAGHQCFDFGADVLVIYGAFELVVVRAVSAIGHGLVLQGAFAALVADGAIERVVDEQELHGAFAGVDGERAIGADAHVFGHRPVAGGDGFGHAFDLDQTHAAVAGNGEPIVVAEVRNFLAPRCRPA